uniref:Uncharacterized protein n=1 Tax=Anopheles atroparvus TaxID=41427 RepID=A0A182IX96_ANOAO
MVPGPSGICSSAEAKVAQLTVSQNRRHPGAVVVLRCALALALHGSPPAHVTFFSDSALVELGPLASITIQSDRPEATAHGFSRQEPLEDAEPGRSWGDFKWEKRMQALKMIKMLHFPRKVVAVLDVAVDVGLLLAVVMMMMMMMMMM